MELAIAVLLLFILIAFAPDFVAGVFAIIWFLAKAAVALGVIAVLGLWILSAVYG